MTATKTSGAVYALRASSRCVQPRPGNNIHTNGKAAADMNESSASQIVREAGEAARQAARWADPLTEAERDELAGALARAFARYDFKNWDSYGTSDPARVMAAAECRDLRLDVIGRRGVYG